MTKRIFKTEFFFYLLTFLCVLVKGQKDIDTLIEEIFGSSTPEPPFIGGSSTRPPTNPDYIGCGPGLDCVPLYLCKDNQVITNGETLIDIRFDPNEPQQCPSLEQCCAISNQVTNPIFTPPPAPEGCGFRNTDGVGFKITGDKNNETQYGEFPWMVAILKEEISQNKILNIYQCGGSLIHPYVILTAAHCVIGEIASTLKVRAGEWDTQTKAELLPDQDRNVVEIIINENYNRGSLYNDVALLIVNSPFELTDNVRTVCLPPTNANFDYSRCFATGWGKDVFGREGKYQVILKKIDLPIIPHDECQFALRMTRLGNRFQLHRSFLCAGGEIGKDTCKGDGGSPLVCPIPGGTREQYYQAGIVAWGIGCGDAIPGVYANIPYLRSWIDEQLAYRRIDSKSFTP